MAGSRACVTGHVRPGAHEVCTHPIRIAAGLRIAGAVCEGTSATALGMERTLRIDGVVLIERIVVPREAPSCLFEWQAVDDDASFDVAWTTGLDADDPGGTAGSLRWRVAPWGAMVASVTYQAAFVGWDGVGAFVVEDAADGGPRLQVRARIAVPAGGSARLALAGGPDVATVTRALRSAARGRAVVMARRGRLDRLRQERLCVESPDAALDLALEGAGLRLADRLIHVPGVGRSFVAGYEPERLAFITADAVHAALDSMLLGDFDAGRDVLRFIGRRLDPDGLAPAACTTAGAVEGGDVAATLLYVGLAARFVTWTGDLPFLRAEWHRVLPGCEALLRAVDRTGEHAPGPVHVPPGVLAEVSLAAESIGDNAAAKALRHAARDRAAVDREAGKQAPLDPLRQGEGSGALDRVRQILGPEPDAPRGRLALRPRLPSDWDRFAVRNLFMGDVAVDLEYRRSARLHRFVVAQRRGSAPIRLILAPELPGRLVAARVDGASAELDPVVLGDRVQVPVQLALDHPRTLELQM